VSRDARRHAKADGHLSMPSKATIRFGADSPSRGEAQLSQPHNEATITRRRPEDKAVVSLGAQQISASQHLPTAQTRPSQPPMPSIRAAPARLARGKLKPVPEMLMVPRRRSLASTNVVSLASPREVPLVRTQSQLQRDKIGQGSANGQAQALPSTALGEMGEERQDYTVVSKIIRATSMPCSPKPLAALASPDPSSVSQAQTSPRQPLDELLLPVESMPGRSKFPIVSSRNAVSGKSSPKYETAQKQSEGLKTPSREGACLDRAAAYVLERLGKCLPACDAFPACPHKAELPKTTERKAGQRDIDIVSKGTTDAVEHMPYATIAPVLPVSPPAFPMRAEIPYQSSNKPMLPLPSSIEAAAEREHSSEHSPIEWEFVNRAPANAKAPCASPSKDSSPGLHLAPSSLASPNNDLVSNNIILETLRGHLLVKIREGGEWSSQEAISKMEESTCTYSPEPAAALTPLATSPALTQAYSHLLPSLELGWRAHCKPPDMMGTFRRRYTKVVTVADHFYNAPRL
jgi:hypothetical protein